MINISDKHNCCGCSACVQACPKQCISFEEDEKGFRYPQVDSAACVDCGLCEKVCPVLHVGAPRKPLKVYAAINPNEEIRLKSSSGGVFTLLAESVINEGGVVFGARFNEQWEVIHDFTETKDGLEPFRGSKYVQSIIDDCYKHAKQFLLAGRKVLFSGTPCQIAGLKTFLGKEYENLLTVDVVCHGVPSPMVWREYLAEIAKDKEHNISYVSFREKSNGWKNYSIVVKDRIQNDLVNESFKKNLYMQLFLKNLSLRPSCYACKCKSGSCGSDMTIADFWGIQDPNMDDDKGTSLFLLYTNCGEKEIASCLKAETEYESAVKLNPYINISAKETKFVADFWFGFANARFQCMQSIFKEFKPSFFRTVYNKLRRLI